METKEAIALWKEKNVDRCIMEFSCGGDSMNDYSFVLYDDSDNEVDCKELEDYFENEVFHNVEFYEASDGHYLGESGEVVIMLEDDQFAYHKDSNSEWSEQASDAFEYPLTDDQFNVVNKYVRNIVGGDEGDFINYRIDFIMTDEIDDILQDIKDDIHNLSDEHEFVDQEGDSENWWRYEAELDVDKKIMNVTVTRNFIIERD